MADVVAVARARVEAGVPPGAVVAGAAVGVADALGVAAGQAVAMLTEADAAASIPDDETRAAVGGGVGPELVGMVHEAVLPPALRRKRGAYYTPTSLAMLLGSMALPDRTGVEKVWDPSCGGGAFLLAAAELLRAVGGDPRTIVAEQLYGTDLAPDAVAVTRAAAHLWAAQWGVPDVDPPHIVVGDGLLTQPAVPVDAVVGNPPFLNQQGRRTTRDPTLSARLRRRFGDSITSTVDTSAVFLLSGIEALVPGGRLVLLQPISLFATAGATKLRARARHAAILEQVWIDTVGSFDAAVRTCAVGLRTPTTDVDPSSPPEVRRVVGDSIRPVEALHVPLDRPRWSRLLAGVYEDAPPVTELSDEGTVNDVATTTAGFRDEYYGLVGHVVDRVEGPDDRWPPLVTSGLVEVGVCEWGRREARFAREVWRHPRVDLDALPAEGKAAEWVRARLEPKLLVATQGRVVEAIVDVEGVLVPSTPVIAVHAAPQVLWHLAAALLSPPVSAWAVEEHRGAALSVGALKLAARDVGELPLPARRAAWDDGAARAEALFGGQVLGRAATIDAGELAAFGRVMCAAYGVEGERAVELTEWWLDRQRPAADAARPLRRGALDA